MYDLSKLTQATCEQRRTKLKSDKIESEIEIFLCNNNWIDISNQEVGPPPQIFFILYYLRVKENIIATVKDMRLKFR